jgi:hypothetical protein
VLQTTSAAFAISHTAGAANKYCNNAQSLSRTPQAHMHKSNLQVMLHSCCRAILQVAKDANNICSIGISKTAGAANK